MIRYFSLLLVVASAISAERTAIAKQKYGLGIPSEGRFDIIEGKPCLLRKGEHAQPGNWVAFGTRNRLDCREGALVYPIAGEDPTLSIGKKEGYSDRWSLSAFPNNELRGSGLPIRATEGEFRGWYLDWSDDETEVVLDDRTVHVRYLILVKEPEMPRKFTKYPVAP